MKQLITQHGGQNPAARATGIKQQTISAILAGRVGWDSLEAVAKVYGEEPAALVERYSPDRKRPSKRSVDIRVGDVPGWEVARREAEERWGSRIPRWAWRLAENVRLPARPVEMSRELAYELADFIARFCQASGVVRVDRRTD